LAQPWVAQRKTIETLKALANPRMILLDAFRVGLEAAEIPGFVQRQPLKVANAFGVQN
jgi:hypothetical protein